MSNESQEFRDTVEMLQKKYLCKDLKFTRYDLTEEQKLKRRFDEDDLHFEKGQDLETNELWIPAFYEEKLDLPMIGSKFIRSQIDFYCGDLAQVTVFIGFWKLKGHDLQHKDYVVTDKNTVHFAFWKEKNRWAMLNQEEWLKRKIELDEDLANPILRKMELEFYDVLQDLAKTRKAYINTHKKNAFYDMVESIENAKWHMENVPMLWSAFKLYNQDMYKRVLERIKTVYEDTLKDTKTYAAKLEEYEEVEIIPYEEGTVVYEFDEGMKPLVLEGFEAFDDIVFPNPKRMYTEKQQTERYANYETLVRYKEIALERSIKKQERFVWFKDVASQYDVHG